MENPGRKFWLSVIWGASLVVVLLILLAFGIRETTVLCAWLAAFLGVPTQFSIANASIARAYAGAPSKDDGK
jgi:hypothetical protein